jgi:hypothetical protein
MTIQTDNYFTRKSIISATPDSLKEESGIDNLALYAKTSKLTLTQKLNAFDPTVHGGELMAYPSVGAEFGERA